MLEVGTALSNPVKDKVWTPETEQQLRQLWADGLSASRISQQIPGSTRNGCIGKANRMGLSGRRQAPSLNPVRIRAKKERVLSEIKPPLPAPEPPKGDLIPFMRSNSKTCRSVEGYGEDEKGHTLALFCPNPKDIEASFCAFHQNIYYRKDVR